MEPSKGLIPKPNVHVTIGEICATNQPAIFQTVLGSCVSACLFDPVHKVAGMNHILLPGEADYYAYDESTRYGIHAMEILVNEIVKLGGVRAKLHAKIFGGGHILLDSDPNLSPGPRNVDFVLKYLTIEGIPVISQNTGGTFTRRIFFHTDNFDVFVKKIQARSLKQVISGEDSYFNAVREQIKKPSDILLFD